MTRFEKWFDQNITEHEVNNLLNKMRKMLKNKHLMVQCARDHYQYGCCLWLKDKVGNAYIYRKGQQLECTFLPLPARILKYLEGEYSDQ